MAFNNAFICESSVLIFHNIICLIVLALLDCQLETLGDREPQLRNCLHQISLWTPALVIFLTDK